MADDDDESRDRDLLVIVSDLPVTVYHDGLSAREDLKILLCRLLRKHGLTPSNGTFRQKNQGYIEWNLYLNELYKFRIHYNTDAIGLFLIRRDSDGFTMNVEVTLGDERSDAVLEHQIHYFMRFATGNSTKGAGRA